MRSDLTFIEDTHEYFVGLKRVPSVSEIMKPLTEAALSSVPIKKLEIARDRGIGVHKAIEKYIKLGVFDENYADYLDQFILFLMETDLQVIESELMLTDGEYAGTIDLIVKDAKNNLWIVDTKTTYVIAPYVPVQFAGYDNLATFNGYKIKGCKVLHLKDDSYNYTLRTPDTEKWRSLLAEYKNKSDQHTY